MSLHIKDGADSSDENMITQNHDNDSVYEESSQAVNTEKQFNISARRRVEEYLESKRLSSLTADYYFAD